MAKTKKPASVIVRARVPPATAKRLKSLARSQHKTESELLREAIELLDLRERRRIAVEELIKFIPERIPTKDEYAARFGKY